MDKTLDPTEQMSVTLPNGSIGTGVGGDIEAFKATVEQRHLERTGESVEAVMSDAQGETIEPAKPATRGQKRFDDLTREREDATRRAEAAERERDELRAKVATPAQPVIAKPVAPVVDAPTRAKPTEAEIGSKYQSLSDYIEDLSDWKLEQREAKLRADFDARLDQRIEADRTTRNRYSLFTDAMNRGKAAYTDFDAVLDSVKTIPVPATQQDAVWKVEKPEAVMYALAKDPAELRKFVALTDPIEIGMAIAQFIPRTEAVAQSPASTPVAVRTTNAPAPPQPVGPGSRTAQPSLQELAASGNYEAYKARRQSERSA